VRAGEFDRALEEIDAAARGGPEGAAAEGAAQPEAGQDEVPDSVLRQKMGVYQSAERMDDYIRVAQVALEAAPRDPTLNNDLGYTWVDRGENLGKATRMIRLAVAADPLNAAYLDSLGWAYYKAGDFGPAREQLARAVRLREGQDPVLFDHLGDAEFRLGDAEAARRSWKKAVELCEAEKLPERRERNAKTEQAVRMKLASLERGEKPSVAPIVGEMP
jgi:tetratricopeptide (TPR) repeat protein